MMELGMATAAMRTARQLRMKIQTMALARMLEGYWHQLGYPAARFWAEPINERFAKVGTYELYRVVCNLVNGLPPRYRN